MIVSVNLKNLKLSNIEYDDEVLRYNEYRLELWNSFLTKITEKFALAQEFFFQDDISIDKEMVESEGLDEESVVEELINLIFDNTQKAKAVQLYTLADYQDLKEDTVMYNAPVLYTYSGGDLDTYYKDEVISAAKEYKTEYLSNMSLSEYVDEYIMSYIKFINVDKLVEFIKVGLSESDTTISYDGDDDIEFLKVYNEEFEDMVEIIEDNDLFDYTAVVEDELSDIDEAIEEITPYIGDMVFSKEIEIGKWNTQIVYVFERY